MAYTISQLDPKKIEENATIVLVNPQGQVYGNVYKKQGDKIVSVGPFNENIPNQTFTYQLGQFGLNKISGGGSSIAEQFKYFLPEVQEEARLATNNFGQGMSAPDADQYTGKTMGQTSGGKILYELKSGDVTSKAPPAGVQIIGDVIEERNKVEKTPSPTPTPQQPQAPQQTTNQLPSGTGKKLTPDEYERTRTAYGVGPNNFDQFFVRSGNDIYVKSGITVPPEQTNTPTTPTPTPSPTPTPQQPQTPQQQTPTTSTTKTTTPETGATPTQVREIYVKYFDRVPTLEEFEHHAQKKTPLDLLEEWASSHPESIIKTQEQQQVGQSAPQRKDVILPETLISGQADFRGAGTFIKFLEDPDGPGPQSASTVWYVDPETKTLRPILSEAAFSNYFKETLADVEARGGIVTVPMAILNQGNMFAGYTLLKDNEGIGSGKEFAKPEAPAVSVDSTKLASRYGKQANEQLEKHVLNKWLVEGLFANLKSDPNDGISSEIIDEISKDPDIVRQYVYALAYGDYSPPDIIRDLKRRQLIKEGRDDLKNVRVIDDGIVASQYYVTPDGSSAKNNADLLPPQYLAGVDMAMLESSIFKIPTEVFQTLVPPFDWTTPEGQAEMDKIKSAFYDVSIKQLEANTERDKIIADQNYKQLQKDVSRAYGITLSNNAQEAWSQISNLGQTLSGRGISESGLHEEAQSKYLEERRRADERLREQNKRNYYLQSATPDEVAKLSAEEKEKYGLTPSQEMSQFFTKENLKAQYPSLTDAEIEAYRTSIIDPSGSYRSNLYQTLAQNKLDLEQKKRAYQFGGVQTDQYGNITNAYGAIGKKALEEEERYREFDQTPSIPYQEKPEYAINI